MQTLVAICVRHGDTQVNDSGSFRSMLDPSLNDKGLEQADAAAEFIAGEDLDIERIISSPMLRAMQTADRISEELRIPVEQERALLPWHLGVLGGKNKEQYQFILDSFVDNPKEVIPDGESLDHMEQRVYEFFKSEFEKDSLAVYITHTSDIVTLENLIQGNHDGRPEAGETSTGTGGVLGIYVDDSGRYSTEILFGKSKPAEFGS